MIQVGVVGATGYTGAELIDIICRHPQVSVAFATSQSFAGKKLSDIYPQSPDLTLIEVDSADFSTVDAVFLCLPHAASAKTAVKALSAGTRVLDLSADFRLKDVAVYEHWYGVTHPAPELLKDAVYGLTEFSRGTLPEARLVAVPGCYPTSVLLGTWPLMEAGVINGTVIADSKSGVSGAGRTPKAGTHFVHVSDNFFPYKPGQSHRHWPEIKQGLGMFNPDVEVPEVIFTPHLLPVQRGILSTIYVPISADYATARALFLEKYANEPFITVLPEGQLATLAHVIRTNQVAISLTMAGDTLVVVVAEDNLQKGAAGQAVQNLNVMFGFTEAEGLR